MLDPKDWVPKLGPKFGTKDGFYGCFQILGPDIGSQGGVPWLGIKRLGQMVEFQG